jgi:hypothetical protein
MASIPIVSGIYTDAGPDVRVSYPVNLMPVPKGTGASEYYLRPHDGVVQLGSTVPPGVDRGGINWNGVCYRVMGSKLVTVSSTGAIAVLGDVGDDGRQVTLDYSFDLLGIASNGGLWFWNPTTSTLTQNTDPDLGTVVDMCWVDGYWMTTDGEFLVVTDLGNPFSVNPLKYGSSEADPDPVVGLVKLRNEVYAINSNTIEVFDNVGTAGFPFQRVDGAQIQKGAVGTFAACVFDEQIAFVGSGRNESPSVYLGANATATPIATQDIDTLLQTYTEDQLAAVRIEPRLDRTHKLLYVHLPDRTVVYDHAASQAIQQPVWFTLMSTTAEQGAFLARNLVWCYGRWIVGSPTTLVGTFDLATESGSLLTTESGLAIEITTAPAAQVGYLDDQVTTHWNRTIRWEFATPIVYNESKGAIFNSMELVALTGRMALGAVPTISTSYTLDGQNWSQDRTISAGTIGNGQKRLLWTRQGFMRNWRVQRFRGTSDAHLSFLRLEAQLEPLEV